MVIKWRKRDSVGQTWLGSIQGLYLAFLIDTKHQSLIRWVQVKPNDVMGLIHEGQIG